MRKKEYKALYKELKKEIDYLGCKIRIKKFRPILPNKFGVCGSYSAKNKIINIRIYGNQSYSTILATIAHELRHAMHDAQGLFSDYYNLKYTSDEYLKTLKENPELLINDQPSLENAQKAEDDCNLFAISWMQLKGYPLDKTKRTYTPYFEPYPQYQIAIYHAWRTIQNIKDKNLLKTGQESVTASI